MFDDCTKYKREIEDLELQLKSRDEYVSEIAKLSRKEEKKLGELNEDLVNVIELLAQTVVKYNHSYTTMYVNEFFNPKSRSDDNKDVLKTLIQNLTKLVRLNSENYEWYEKKFERIKLNNGRYTRQDILEDVIEDLVKVNKDLTENNEKLKDLNKKLEKSEKERKCLAMALKELNKDGNND